ncbi:MAG: hypothetical protein HY543_00510 [Deltaproteobacteria bacterium]|nr:hypothetical protein [Deltaproteobacteria bacterium]
MSYGDGTALQRAARHFADTLTNGTSAGHGVYNATAPYLSRHAGPDGLIALTPQPLAPPATREELIARHRISIEEARALCAGKFVLMTVGRSGFVNEDDNRHFGKVLQDFFNQMFHLLRRAGIDPSATLAMTTSATAGTVDIGIRRTAAFHRIPCVAFIDDTLMPWVDPNDAFMPGVVHTGSNRDYSDVSIAEADTVLTLPGGAFSLLNDMPWALRQGKEIVMVYDPRIPKTDRSIFDGSSRIGNHATMIADEIDALTDSISDAVADATGGARYSKTELWDPRFTHAELVRDRIMSGASALAQLSRKMTEFGHPMSPQAIWQRITVVRNPKELATYLSRRLGSHGRSLDEMIVKRTDAPVTAGTASLAGTKMNAAFTGRSQFINRGAGDAELRLIATMLKQLDALFTNRFGYSRRDIGVIHGMSNFGADGVFLREFVLKGHPAIGIVKPEWAEWIDAEAKRRSDYVLTDDTYTAFSQGFMGMNLGFDTDALVVFEGNAGVKDHIRSALRRGVPVIVVPLSSDPLYGDFWDVQKGKLCTDRLQNVGRWVLQEERRKIIPQFLAKISTLTGLDLSAQWGDDRTTALSSIAAAIAQLQGNAETDEQRTALQHAAYLLTEVQEMWDPTTTVEGNDNLIIARNASEIAYLLHRIERRKTARKKRATFPETGR